MHVRCIPKVKRNFLTRSCVRHLVFPMGLFSNSIRRFQLFHKTLEAKGESNIRWVKFVYAQVYIVNEYRVRLDICSVWNGLKSLQGNWM